MKTMITFLLSVLSLSLTAQTVTVAFQGAANRNKSYQVVIDGVSYYSANSVSNNGRQVTTINNLAEGSHTLEVHSLTSNNKGYNDGSTSRPSTRPVYTKTFQLREGYDMNIAVRGNGQVSFTEKQSQKQLTASNRTPMTSTAFNQLVQNVSSKRYQSDKISLVRTALTTAANYFTTSQVRQLLSSITTESRRLELAKLSYNKVTDPANFSTLYDVLQSEASRDALDNYVVEQGGSIESNESYSAYGTAMSSSAFTQLLNITRSYTYQPDRISEIRSAMENTSTYFNTSQVRQLLTLVNSETERLSLAKLAYNRVVDRNAFNGLADLFYTQTNQNEFNNFISNNGGTSGTINNSTYVSPMTDPAFLQVYNKARGHFFQKNTVADVQTAFSTTTNYFSTDQIRTLLQLVTTESTRLELAKLAYARAVDPSNYTALLDLFTLQSSRTDLENYIRSKQ